MKIYTPKEMEELKKEINELSLADELKYLKSNLYVYVLNDLKRYSLSMRSWSIRSRAFNLWKFYFDEDDLKYIYNNLESKDIEDEEINEDIKDEIKKLLNEKFPYVIKDDFINKNKQDFHSIKMKYFNLAEMKYFKENINTFSLEEKLDLLDSNLCKYILEDFKKICINWDDEEVSLMALRFFDQYDLRDICVEWNNEKVCLKAFYLWEDSFNKYKLEDICIKSKFEKVRILAFELWKNLFYELHLNICMRSKDEKVRDESFELWKKYFNKYDLTDICCCEYEDVWIKAFNSLIRVISNYDDYGYHMYKICVYWKVKNIKDEALELLKEFFNLYYLKLICIEWKDENIIFKAFDLWKHKFNKEDLESIYKEANNEKIKLIAKELLDEFNVRK